MTKLSGCEINGAWAALAKIYDSLWAKVYPASAPLCAAPDRRDSLQSQKRHGHVLQRLTEIDRFRISSPPLSTSTSGIGNARTVSSTPAHPGAPFQYPWFVTPEPLHCTLKIITELLLKSRQHSGFIPGHSSRALKQGDDATVPAPEHARDGLTQSGLPPARQTPA